VLHQLQWTVFEPNDAMLRAGLRRMLDALLGNLFALGAFAGATPAESWFVRVADAATISRESDSGQVVVEVGIAPAEPVEFIVVRVSLDADGAIEARLLGTTPTLGAVSG
jgi:phage tail sheath protein FI